MRPLAPEVHLAAEERYSDFQDLLLEHAEGLAGYGESVADAVEQLVRLGLFGSVASIAIQSTTR